MEFFPFTTIARLWKQIIGLAAIAALSDVLEDRSRK